jgi:hypothetical protein
MSSGGGGGGVALRQISIRPGSHTAAQSQSASSTGIMNPGRHIPDKKDLLLAREASLRANLENLDVMRQVDNGALGTPRRHHPCVACGSRGDDGQRDELGMLLHEALST